MKGNIEPGEWILIGVIITFISMVVFIGLYSTIKPPESNITPYELTKGHWECQDWEATKECDSWKIDINIFCEENSDLYYYQLCEVSKKWFERCKENYKVCTKEAWVR